MPGDLYYSGEKYEKALYLLATSDDDLRTRLREAYADQALHGLPQAGAGPEFSQDLADRIVEFDRRLTSREARGDEGRLAATIQQMTDNEVYEAAAEMVSIALALVAAEAALDKD